MEWTKQTTINLCKKLTKEASLVPDSKLRRVKDKENKKKAKELAKGKGYIIATFKEMGYSNPMKTAKYGSRNQIEDNRKYIWCYQASTNFRLSRPKVEISLIPVA